MKKLFAYAAMALAALILTTHSDAKPGGFAKPMAWHAHPHGAHFNHFAHRRFDHHRRFARDFLFPFPGFFDNGPYGYDYGAYAGPQIVEVPQDVTGSTDLRRVSAREAGPHGCSTENVTVPSSQGGETTVRVIRC